jgi:hypothetical protein
MNAQTQALVYRFILGLILTLIPIIIAALQRPDFDWKWSLAAVLGGLLAALEKYVAPSILNLPAATKTSAVAEALGASESQTGQSAQPRE